MNIFKKKVQPEQSLDDHYKARLTIKHRTLNAIRREADYVEQLRYFLENNRNNKGVLQKTQRLIQQHWENIVYVEGNPQMLMHNELRMQVAKNVMEELNNR
jgi:hypothetical protein